MKLIIVFLLCCVLTATTTVSVLPHNMVKAYTEAEKKMAKSWLAAHGYSPTEDGAYQAYQDYMDGKLKLDNEDEKQVDKVKNSKSNKDKDSSIKSTNKGKNKNEKSKQNSNQKPSQKPKLNITKNPQKTANDAEPGRTIAPETTPVPSASSIVKRDMDGSSIRTDKETRSKVLIRNLILGGIVVAFLCTCLVFIIKKKYKK